MGEEKHAKIFGPKPQDRSNPLWEITGISSQPSAGVLPRQRSPAQQAGLGLQALPASWCEERSCLLTCILCRQQGLGEAGRQGAPSSAPASGLQTGRNRSGQHGRGQTAVTPADLERSEQRVRKHKQDLGLFLTISPGFTFPSRAWFWKLICSNQEPTLCSSATDPWGPQQQLTDGHRSRISLASLWQLVLSASQIMKS